MIRVLFGRAHRWWRDRGLLVGPYWQFIDVNRLIQTMTPDEAPLTITLGRSSKTISVPVAWLDDLPTTNPRYWTA